MIVSGQTLRRVQPVSPFCERTRYNGVTYGVGPAGCDVRIDQTRSLSRNTATTGSGWSTLRARCKQEQLSRKDAAGAPSGKRYLR